MDKLTRILLFGLILIIPVCMLTGAGAIFFKVAFIFLLIIMVFNIAHLTISKGFEDLEVRRNIKTNKIFSGEEIEYEIIIENKKKFPIIFLLIKEALPKEFGFKDNTKVQEDCDSIRMVHKCAIYGYERIKRKNTVRIDKRGTYIFKDIEENIGDFFGLIDKSQKVQDPHEILVYPTIKDLSSFNIKSMNIIGDNVVRRWIHHDPLYIKSIREYCGRDRMKDIHWKSSLKMNKLMSKEYDYTSDKEIIIIANIQSHKEVFMNISEEVVERTISVSISLADKCLKEGVAVGMWTNASTKSLAAGYIEEVPSSLNSMEKILELGARMDYVPLGKFNKLLMRKIKYFNTNAIYVVVTPYLDDECIFILNKLSRRGVNLKIVDVSNDLNLPSIQGIEKLECSQEVK
ncbi:DUF58 domain-containing protein [Oceanirhabdus sp. W0125-5]|uniref:DUF58 domain-containing protein n=1 Tax=Oceanirhabdus sp. W0125-5 TaxID=2999116 RepID=UPI0022F2ACBC|nr:DUF58 domain-containing protein [Oceanirhabdus sp. W0125-5]WBW97187.1 DUF58 domain-containing protein [Oceanirhabdus sp. W0125-5]